MDSDSLGKLNNMSPHQFMVGQTYFVKSMANICLAAHEDAILILQIKKDGTPFQYVVCTMPKVDEDGLHWSHGSYFTFLNYQHDGLPNPMSAAFVAASHCLVNRRERTLLIFSYAKGEDDEEALAPLYAQCDCGITNDQIVGIEDFITNTIDMLAPSEYTKLIEEAMRRNGVGFSLVTEPVQFSL